MCNALISCAICATVHTAGRVKEPLSDSIPPKKAENKVDLPAPLTPVKPIFQPGCSCIDAFWNKTRPPRRNETWSNWIMSMHNSKKIAHSKGIAHESKLLSSRC